LDLKALFLYKPLTGADGAKTKGSPMNALTYSKFAAVLFALAIPLIGGTAEACPQHSHHPVTTPKDKPSVHGMLMVGTEHVYLSHLPMFHSPHDYQIILKAKTHALKIYQADKAAHPEEKLYTIEPETFVLPEMVKSPKPFKATIYRGHFERGGTPIATDVTFEIEEVVHFAKFDPKAGKPTHASYLVFGGGTELFLAHVITAKPDFDQVLAIEKAQGLAPMAPGAPAIKMLAKGQPNGAPLDQKKTIVLENAQGSATVEAMKEIYLEFGDLAH
jgi:hypothetical protein